MGVCNAKIDYSIVNRQNSCGQMQGYAILFAAALFLTCALQKTRANEKGIKEVDASQVDVLVRDEGVENDSLNSKNTGLFLGNLLWKNAKDIQSLSSNFRSDSGFKKHFTDPP